VKYDYKVQSWLFSLYIGKLALLIGHFAMPIPDAFFFFFKFKHHDLKKYMRNLSRQKKISTR